MTGGEQAQFGYAVSVHGDTVLIGSYGDPYAGEDSGSAHVFVRSDGVWSLQAQLFAPEGLGGARFGYAVSIEDDVAVVGAYGVLPDGSNNGAAYVFNRQGSAWVAAETLTAADAGEDGEGDDDFGYAVSIYGDTMLVGSPGDYTPMEMSGSVYVYRRNGGVWDFAQKIVPFDGAQGDAFGYSVALMGTTVATGAFKDDSQGTDSGSVYTYEFKGTCSAEGECVCHSGFSGMDCSVSF